MRILLTGGTGFIGKVLVPALVARGHGVTLLTRSPDRVRSAPGVKAVKWDAENEPLPAEEANAADAILHLAGENVAGGRWTDEMKKRIVDSRVRSGEAIRSAIAKRPTPLPVLIGASAIGYYGNAGDRLLPETAPLGSGFLADVCRQWEAALADAKATRQVTVRIGVVLGRDGGALEKMLPPFKLGIGGKIGSGKQWMSWIHVDDVCAVLLRAIENATFSGVYNAVAPEPVQNGPFVDALAHALHRPSVMTVPAIALKLALGQMADETVLASQRVIPERLRAAGFSYRYPDLAEAIKSVL